MRIYAGHMDTGGHVPEGLDLVLWIHDDGTHIVATRPGRDQTHTSFSTETVLAPARVTS